MARERASRAVGRGAICPPTCRSRPRSGSASGLVPGADGGGGAAVVARDGLVGAVGGRAIREGSRPARAEQINCSPPNRDVGEGLTGRRTTRPVNEASAVQPYRRDADASGSGVTSGPRAASREAGAAVRSALLELRAV